MQLKKVEDGDCDKDAVLSGPDVQLAYAGSKLYYRSNTSIDFTMYHHVRCSCVEVIGCEVVSIGGDQATLELRRIYLDHDKLLANIEPAVQTEVQRRLHEVTEKNKGNINTALLTGGPSCTNLTEHACKCEQTCAS